VIKKIQGWLARLVVKLAIKSGLAEVEWLPSVLPNPNKRPPTPPSQET
jgi:hypothetical protein